MSRPKVDVLVVDDDESVAEWLCEALADLFDVRAVHGVRDALVALRLRRPAVVVTDLCMDGDGGEHLLAHLTTRHRQIRRVVHSGAVVDGGRRLIEAGLADAVVVKTGDAASLRSVLLRLLECNLQEPAL